MSSFVAFTCSKAEATFLGTLLNALTPAFARLGGQVMPRQGPASGFFDPAFGEIVELRSFRFPTRSMAERALETQEFHATQALRARFRRLDITVTDRP